jgi:hypothetical protein
VVQKLGNAAFSKVYKTPPASSQHILHPEKYLAGEQPVEVDLPSIVKRKEWRTLTEGTVGEFDHAVLIEQYLGKEKSEELGPAWRGGQLEILENRKHKRIALLYASEWDTPENARKMFDAYRTVLEGKWKTVNPEEESESIFAGTGDDGYFRVTLDGTRIASVEGFASSTDVEGDRLN